MASGGHKAIIAALVANLGIAVTKLAAWILTSSSSMLAEAIHSFADSGNQLLMLIGSRRSTRKADETHQFGFGRTRYITAFVVSIVLFTLGGLFALYEAFHKFVDPHPITAWHWVPIVVLLIGILLEGNSLRTAVLEARKLRGQMPLFTYLKQSRAPEIPVILLEDIAAMLGLVVALVGVSLTLWTGDGRWDALGSAVIGMLLVVVTTFLGSETLSMLVGEGATPDNLKLIRKVLTESGLNIWTLRTLHLGPDTLLVVAKVGIPSELTTNQISEKLNQAETAVAESLTTLKCEIYLEPDFGSARS
ncbi:cation diffusion facilitator family transporter [Boudabousia marimammalium]|uniref:Cation transporter n=1 Tax=Boudabousia marimammalium TaxID=156892 RepID=A0A1Q5PRT4_9ACTO|nr:cation diffusion facilitator family transporter [Boudabousia marimammalium]OKL50209.1 cation transporter [Boudabousia marimammalium]